MLQKTKDKIDEFKESFQELGSSLRTILYIAISALAVACAALLMSLDRNTTAAV